jgi:Domain of unknown function (DUF5134)
VDMTNMSGPIWLADFFAAVTLGAALYSAGRLGAARLWSRPIHVDVDVAHTVMGVAMAGMLVSELSFGSEPFWVVIFSIMAAWFAIKLLGELKGSPVTRQAVSAHSSSHAGAHLLMALAMVYMYVAPSRASPGLGADFTWLPLLLLIGLLAAAIREIDEVGRVAAAVPTHQGPVLSLTIGSATSSGSTDSQLQPADQYEERHVQREQRGFIAPRLETLSHVAMVVAMGYMLVVML